jgi:hypothetical protein
MESQHKLAVSRRISRYIKLTSRQNLFRNDGTLDYEMSMIRRDKQFGIKQGMRPSSLRMERVFILGSSVVID